MSLSRGKRKGRVSYQLLSINQLGEVYEALLSYRGFFADEELYEVQPDPNAKKGRAAVVREEVEGDDESDDEDTVEEGAGQGGGTKDVMESAWFVPASRIGEYTENELVYDTNDEGRKQARKYAKGTFIYRLAGRDREKSASYYTPQVLTRCLVKYALKELLVGKTADDILKLTICEPAMGSAAFLNEAVNQLAEAYLERKQQEKEKRIPHDQYAFELQKTRMFIADRNVFGVDLNPVATELAEVSLWLNAIYGEQPKPGEAPKPARVPWFGYQLFAGNSLVGARRQVYDQMLLSPGKSETKWYDTEPRRLNPMKPVRKETEVYHFLLPDEGMANYTDKVAKSLYPEHFARIKAWRKEFIQPLAASEIKRLQQLSKSIDDLWAEHTRLMKEDRQRTEDPLALWPDAALTTERLTRTQKEMLRKQHVLNEDTDIATPYRRLKLVMDYWCALWFWPITESASLPSRDQWWLEIGAILEGNIVDLAVQPDLPVVPEANKERDDPSSLFSTDKELPGLVDKLGQLRFSKLRQNFSNIKTVEESSSHHRFFHWELAFADIFGGQGGFDLVLGNPPWLKVEWNESGILAEKDPKIALRKMTATEITLLRNEVFSQSPLLKANWTSEFEEASSTQAFLNAFQNYRLLKGVKVNLYKCFLPLSWQLITSKGICGFLHPEGLYDDPNGGLFREAVYRRLKSHFQFVNEHLLFAEVDNHTRYSINIYGDSGSSVCFENIANLFIPSTVDACFAHDSNGPVGGYKTDDGRWNTQGHAARLILITRSQLATFAELYDIPGTPYDQARLPVLHAKGLLDVIEKLAARKERISDRAHEIFSSQHWNEKNDTDNGTISRSSDRAAMFAQTAGEWVISGPHFFVATPFNKTPKRVCAGNKQYDQLDLTAIPDDYLPRTNYVPMGAIDEYRRRTPIVQWQGLAAAEAKPVSDFYRLVFRAMIGSASERTLTGAIIPPGPAHISGAQSNTFKDMRSLIVAGYTSASLTADFFLKTTGRTNLHGTWLQLPWLPDLKSACCRYLALNCLTSHYSELWNKCFDQEFKHEEWSQPSNTRLPSDFWSALSSRWNRNCALRTEYSRRMAMLEIDVIVAQALGLTLSEFLMSYQVQFAVMRGYEKDTWYDGNGRIVFTISKGLAGVGLPRKSKRNDPVIKLISSHGLESDVEGWDDILARQQAGKLPGGSVVSTWAMDDTQPGGPTRRERKYVAPFALANREEDYRIAWEFFERKKAAEAKA
jgi:hypothetical protein